MSTTNDRDQEVIIREFHNDIWNMYDKVKDKAERTINENIERARGIFSDNASYHLIMRKRMIRDGEYNSAQYHKMMAEIYNSVVDGVKNYKAN